jgi:DNA-binding NarL/FixJ family response regulator
MFLQQRQDEGSTPNPGTLTEGSFSSQGKVDTVARIPVSIVSNSRLLRDGLVMVVQPYLPLELIGDYNGEPLPPQRIPNPAGHVLLLDCGIGQMAAMAWVEYARSLACPPQIIMLEMDDSAEKILACVEAGISAFTLRGASPAEVAEAIALARQGGARCSPQILAQLFNRLATAKSLRVDYSVPLSPLTSRELQVLKFIAHGYSNKEIALELVITVRTVKHHVHNILNKLKLSHRRDAVHLALQHGWIEAESTSVMARPVTQD